LKKLPVAVSHLAVTYKMMSVNRRLFWSIGEWGNYEPCKR